MAAAAEGTTPGADPPPPPVIAAPVSAAVSNTDLRTAVLHDLGTADADVAEVARQGDVLAMVDRVARRPDAPLAPVNSRFRGTYEALDRAYRRVPAVAMAVAVGLVLAGLCALMGWPLDQRKRSRYACPNNTSTVTVRPEEAGLAFRNDAAGDTDRVGVARLIPGRYTRDGLALALAEALNSEQERLAVLHRSVTVGGVDPEQVPPEVVAEAVGGVSGEPDVAGQRVMVLMRTREDAEQAAGYVEIRKQLRPVGLVEPDRLEPFECVYLCRPKGRGEALYVGKNGEAFSLLLEGVVDTPSLGRRFVDEVNLSGQSEYLLDFEWRAAQPDPHGSLLVMNTTPDPVWLQRVPDVGEFGKPGDMGALLPGKALRTSSNVRAWTKDRKAAVSMDANMLLAQGRTEGTPLGESVSLPRGAHTLSVDAGGKRTTVKVRGGGPMDVRDFVRRRLRPALLPLDVGVEHQQDRAAAGGDRVVLTGAEAVLQDPSDSPFLRSLLVPMGNDGDGGEVLTLRVRWLRAPTLMVLGRVLTDELRLNVSFAGGAPRAAIDGAGVMEARLYPPGCVLSWRGTGAGHMRRRVPDDVPHKDAVVQRADVAGLNGVDLPFLWRVGVLPPMRPAQRDHLTRNVERSGWPWINESNLKAGGIPQPERVMQAGRVLWALERARASEAADSLAWAACGSWEEALALAQDRMAEYASFSNVQVRVTWAASPGLEWRGATVRPEGCHVELSCVEDGRHTGAHHFRGVPDEEACRRRATEMLEFCANEDEPAQVVFVEGRGPPQVSTVWPSEAAATQLFEDSADYDVLQRATMVRKADSGEVCGGGGASQDCAKSDMLLKVHRDTVHGCQRLCKVHPRCAGIAVPTKASSEMLRRSSQALGALDKLSYIKEELDALREDLHEPDDGSMDRPVAKNSDEEAAKMRERFNNLQAEYDAGTRALDRISKSAEFDCFLLNRDFNEDTVETRFPPSDWAYFLKRSKFYKKQ